jgi:NAD(P)-dependent dehydrogenase (short-subunit alcohol dehydrogenase family)
MYFIGANQGLGFETAKKLLATSSDYHVILGCRDASKGEAAVKTLKSLDGVKGQASTVQIEVTDNKSVDAAAAKVDSDYGRVDILVNNAGVYGGDQLARDTLLNTFNVNVVGVVSVTEAFLPLLRKSSTPRLIFVTTSLASLSHTSDKTSRHYGPYATELRASKAALNMVMVEYANHPEMQGIKVLGADPGFLATNITGDPESLRKMGATEPDVGGEVVAAIVKGEKDADVGKVAGRDGCVPW